ncbi:winged helix-turn-helix domain-containing protein [Isoptericola sp. QY 916]|uniref:winged helix-turn-helix domain-containing protein n=1 Tax=Isoptericola sp. QY 916 TaxID=2782570 RepID=UPI003D2FD5FF|nr:helix-turn-helix transcriptional regulator [Isoptericola sp. QY 916]
MEPTPERPYTHLELTAEAAKVLAHPLRSRLLGALRRGGPASATALAAELSTNTGATSYHLRKLASVGLVTDTEEGRGKERLWAAATQSHGWRDSDFGGDEDAQTALGWLVRDYHRQFDTNYAHWLDVQESWPKEWTDVAGMTDTWVDVTPEQAAAMADELEAVVNKYLRVGTGDPRARRLHLWRFLFPLDADDVPDADAGTAAVDDGPESEDDES